MKIVAASLVVIFCFASIFASPTTPPAGTRASEKVFINMIEGTVYDQNHRPVPDLWVELLNELGMGNRRVRTSSSGHFSFTDVYDGRYEVKVYTSGTPFEEQSQSIEVLNVVQNGSGTFYADFSLKVKKGFAGAVGIPEANEILFAQEVPDAAKQLYKSGIHDLGGADSVKKGQDELAEAIKIFPDYYDALNALGCNYVSSKDYQKSLPYLIHAIDINQRSFSSFYSLGYAAYKLKHFPEASEAARAATILQPNSFNAQLLYGSVLTILGNYDIALPTLLKAEKLNKDMGEVHWQLGMLYSRTKKNKDAVAELETYLKLTPDLPNRKAVEELIEKLKTAPARTTT